MRKPLLLAATVMLIMTACRAEANFTLDVNEDGSGTLAAEVGIDDELADLVEQFGGGTEDLLALVPEGQDVEERREGDMTFYGAQEMFTDTTDLRQTTGVFEGADVTFAQLDLVVEDGGARLDARIEAPDAGETLEGLGGDGIAGFADDIFSSNLFVSLPGELEESNADEVMADGRLRWEIPLLGGAVDIHAVTVAGGGGIPWLIIGAIAAAILLIAAAIFWPRRRYQSSVGAIDATETPPPPAGFFDPTAEMTDSPPPAAEG